MFRVDYTCSGVGQYSKDRMAQSIVGTTCVDYRPHTTHKRHHIIQHKRVDQALVWNFIHDTLPGGCRLDCVRFPFQLPVLTWLSLASKLSARTGQMVLLMRSMDRLLLLSYTWWVILF